MSLSDEWKLPGDSETAPDAQEQETLSVPEVGERIRGLLGQAFPTRFWLVGEAVEWDRTRRKSPRGHWYFRLVDDQAEGDRRASLSVKMWRHTVEKLFGPRGRLKGSIEPTDGVVVRVLVKPDFWPPSGQISFTIEDVDPEHTLGTLDRQRRELLARLEQEGAGAWNKALPLTEPPLSVGLVTSAGSAAHHDVLRTLQASGLGFQVALCDARTQGADTTASVLAALATLSACKPDVILLVRGGGSRVDLSWFDQEAVARAVATCEIPVITGIGHEIDTSVTDLMAHLACHTPTAAAEFLVGRAREAADGIEATRDALLGYIERTLGDQDQWLRQIAQALSLTSQAAVTSCETSLAADANRLRELGEQALTAASEALAGWRSRLASGAHVERLGRLEAQLQVDAERLAHRALAGLDLCALALDSAAERARLLDPQSVLSRGYAYLRRADGSVLMDAARSDQGELLTAILRDGELDLRADAVRLAQSAQADEST